MHRRHGFRERLSKAELKVAQSAIREEQDRATPRGALAWDKGQVVKVASMTDEVATKAASVTD